MVGWLSGNFSVSCPHESSPAAASVCTIWNRCGCPSALSARTRAASFIDEFLSIDRARIKPKLGSRRPDQGIRGMLAVRLRGLAAALNCGLGAVPERDAVDVGEVVADLRWHPRAGGHDAGEVQRV